MSNFDASSVNGLIGLWDFRNGAELSDTGLDDGVAQNGWLHGDAGISGDRLHLDGHGDYFEVDGEIVGSTPGDSPNAGDDDPFDMNSGTLEIQFNQDTHIGTSPDTLVSRGEYADRGTEGYFELAVQADGSIYVIHCSNGADIWKMSTNAGLASPGDTINVKYTWDAATGVQLQVENVSTGATETVSSDTTGLTMDIGDNDDESWQIGARESDDGTYNHFFDGSIDYMAIYEEEAVGGPVDGTNGDDVMLAGFVDAQGDTIDGDDGVDDTVFGYDGDDVISGGEGTNTLFGGSGDDVFIGGDGADNFQGGAGQDNLDYSNSDAAVNVNLETGAMSGGDAENDSILGGIDGVIGSDFDDTLIGFDHQGTNPADTFTNQLFGGAGEDYIEGQGGDDELGGGADDDEIYGGAGEDEITGGTGADYIEGGADNDVIYGGDNGAGGTTTVRESLEWNEAPGFTNDGNASSFVQNTGNVDVTFSILNETGAASTEWETDSQNVSDIDGDGNAIDDSSSLYSVLNGEGNDGDYTLGFSDEVENVSFRINDIDGDGIVNVTAYDADGNQIEISMVGGANLTLTDTDGVAGVDTADSNGGYDADTSEGYSVLINIPGPVARIVIEHDQDGGANTGINITDVYFDAPVTGLADEGDTIFGDGGDDIIFGEAGDDTIDGGEGADQISGGADADRINVLSAADGIGDVVDGGSEGDDNDTLDLTNVGPFRIINETTDPDGNSTSGTVQFLDPTAGAVLGTMDFTEIENILGDPVAPDGTVHGTAGNDVMNPGYVDAQGDTIDGADGDDDIIEAGAGDDTVNAGEGNDTVFGGTGNDSIDGGNGNDTLMGEDDNDTLRGRAGEDTLDGGDGNDNLFGGGDNDSITGGDGNDSAFGGAGDDVIDTSGPVDLVNDIGTPDRGYPGLYDDDSDPNNDNDYVEGGNGDDIITTGDDDDTIYGGAGQDSIYSGVDDDTVFGGNDDDLIVGGEGNDVIEGGQGNDVIYGGLETTDVLDIPDAVDLRPDNGLDTIYGGNGNDTIYGRDDDDVLYGDDGNDVLFGGIDDDTMFGGQGADTFEGGEGSDEQYGGNDRDTFNVLSAADGIGDVIDGGTGGVDEDTLDLTNVGDFQIINQTVDADGDSTSGTVQFLDADGNITGEMNFSEIESIIGTGGPDGTVHGTAGDDVMLPGYIDTQGDTIDGDDGDDDIIEAGDGNDQVNAGNGNDTVFGGEGNDTLSGGDGDDTLFGEEGDDRMFGGDGFDTLYGGIGDDTLSGNRDGDQLFGGEGNDTLNGDIAADTLDGGVGDDLLRGENGDDVIFGGDGSDTADGGDGNDTIDTSGPGSHDLLDPTGNPDRGYPGIFDGDDDPSNDLDTVFGGGGNDTITTGDDNDSIDGGGGNDTIYAGFDDDSITGGAGDDVIVGGEGQDVIEGNDGNDVIYGGLEGIDVLDIPDAIDLRPDNGLDTIYGGEGNDTIYGADDDDSIFGDAGDDVLFGGIDDDTLFGGTGADQFTGGEGSDEQYGGDDADTFTITSTEDAIGDVVDGGSGGDDNDTLNLTGTGPYQIINETVDADGNSTSGTVQFLDAPGGTVIGELQFSEIETIVPCFTPGTMIATMTGEKLVEDLKVGDRVITRDNGAQEIRWMGNKPMSGAQLQANPHLQPVLVRKGSLGGGLPERDMLVSPNHRMLINNAEVGLMFNEPEVLVAAKHLINADKGITSVAASHTTYIHFMFDHHEVVLSNGAWTESFQPGDQAMAGVSKEQRSEIIELFPELANAEGREAFASSRLSLKAYEAKMLK